MNVRGAIHMEYAGDVDATRSKILMQENCERHREEEKRAVKSNGILLVRMCTSFHRFDALRIYLCLVYKRVFFA